MRTLIRNCRLHVAGKIVENCFIQVDEAFVTDFGINDHFNTSYDVEYNAEGRLVLPGIVDVHVHLRDEGFSYKEDFKSGTSSAVLGGVTSVVDMPNNDPPTDSPSRLLNRINIAKDKILANTGFACKPSTDPLINRKLADIGAVAFKIFLYDYMDDDGLDELTLEGILEAVSRTNRRLMAHSNARSPYPLVRAMGGRASVKLCRIEKDLTERLLSLSDKHKVKLHLCHVTCPSVIDVARRGRSGAEVSTEATIHHLFLDSSLYNVIGPLAHVDPPLKNKSSARGLLKRLRSGLIDALVSDHAPHMLEEKTSLDPKPGFPNLQLMMPVLLTQVKRGRLPLSLVVERASSKPATIFKLERRGLLERGYYADLVEVDTKRKFKVKSDMLVSKAKYTPFEGVTLTGLPVRTYVNGICVNDGYSIVGRGGEGMILLPGDRS
ncbi:MAG: dihydroorotase family protein [Candidatus Nezhaarchaeota archaeon]|nr:dihydroorotase family protein [Candidatus Nezhaarchaeota archaeon]